MKTLEQIKDEYAKSKGYEDWIDLLESNSELEFEINRNVNELLILVQKECLKNASENATLERRTIKGILGASTVMPFVSKESITKENNIIK